MYRLIITICWMAFFILSSCSQENNGKQSLIIYSPHGKELLAYFEDRFEEKFPEVNVKWLDMGSQDVLDRLRSEKENPQADIWWGAPSDLFQQAEDEKLLDSYKPTWYQAILEEAHSSRDFWYGTYETPEVIAYNSAVLKPEEVPQDWDDLLDPKWKNKIIIRDPLASGTMRTIFCTMILKAIQEQGSPDSGYAWLMKLDANTKTYVPNLTMLLQKLARQEGWITLWNMPDIELQRARYQYPLDYILPMSGTPVVTDGIALVAKANNKKVAVHFYEFVTSKESLIQAAKLFYRLPCRKDISQNKLPEWFRKTSIKVLPVNWKILRKNSRKWMRYWDENIRNKGT